MFIIIERKGYQPAGNVNLNRSQKSNATPDGETKVATALCNEKLKSKLAVIIASHLQRGECVPDEVQAAYNKAVEDVRNQKQQGAAKTFKERVLARLAYDSAAKLPVEIKSYIDFLYRTISDWKE